MRKLSDDEILADMLFTQASFAQGYSSAALGCAHVAVRNEMLSLMNEEHRLHATIFSELEKRGIGAAQAAESKKIEQIKQKFDGMIPS